MEEKISKYLTIDIYLDYIKNSYKDEQLSKNGSMILTLDKIGYSNGKQTYEKRITIIIYQ